MRSKFWQQLKDEAGVSHPKVREGAMIGAGAEILDNIIVGKGAKVGAGSGVHQ